MFEALVRGYRDADKDNQAAFNFFNKGQFDQLTNLYNAATFAPRVGQQQNLYEGSKFDLYDKGMRTALGMENYDTYATQARMFGQYAPELAQMQIMQQLFGPAMQLAAFSRMFGMGLPGTSPSALLGGK